MFVVADRVKEYTSLVGLGTVPLEGADSSFKTFDSVCSDGDEVYYAIVHRSADEWEIGHSSYTSDNKISRGVVLASSNNNITVDFTAGGRRLGLPGSKVAVVDCVFGIAGSDQPVANVGFSPENNVAESAQGCELAGFEYCNWYWASNWYDVDLTGRYLGRRNCLLDSGNGIEINVSTNVNHPNRTPDGWAGPTYTTGTRPVPV